MALAARTGAAWAVTLLLFFPLGWLVLTAFKTELQAIAVPPLFVFTPTLANYAEVQQRSDYLLYAQNSLVTSVLKTKTLDVTIGKSTSNVTTDATKVTSTATSAASASTG